MTPLSNHEDRDLLEFADAVNAGHGLQPQNDLERTYLHVHRRVNLQGAAMPFDVRQESWESIMSTIAISSPSRSGTRLRARRVRWSPLASVAAAILLVMVGIGTWYTQDNHRTPPDPYQYAAMAPISGNRLQLATPTDHYSCDFSKDMPILESDSNLPVGGTVLYYQSGGSLMLHCDGQAEDIVLAEGVFSVSPVDGIEGLARLQFDSDGREIEFLNVFTGQSFTTRAPSTEDGFLQQSAGDMVQGRFLLVNDYDGKLIALDTTSMEPLVIEDLFGDKLPETFTVQIASTDDGSLLAMIPFNPIRGEQDFRSVAIRGNEIGNPGDILMIDTNTGDTSWLTIPGEDAHLVSMTLSPGGSTVGIFIASPDDPNSRESYVMAINTRDGSVIAQTGYFQAFNYRSVWTKAGLVVQMDDDLSLISIVDSDVRELYHFDSAGTDLGGLQITMDPNVVIVESIACDGECRRKESNVGVTAVNVETGEHTRFMGQNVAYIDWVDQTNLLLMMDPGIFSPDVDTAIVIDPVSGETVTTFENMPGIGYVENQRPTIGPVSIDTQAQGTVTVVAISTQNLIELRSDGTTSTARLLPVPGRWAENPDAHGRANIILSPNGQTLSLSVEGDEAQSRFLLDLSDADAEWIEITPGRGYTQFVMGIGTN